MLSYPNFNKPFNIHDDSRKIQLGALISQEFKTKSLQCHKVKPCINQMYYYQESILSIIETLEEFGAILLLLFYVPATFVIYSFWNDPEELYRDNSIQFMKNLAIIGGLMMVYVNGAGRYSIRRLFATTRLPKKVR